MHTAGLANHNTMGQLTNLSTSRISEGGGTEWCRMKVNYVKNYVFFYLNEALNMLEHINIQDIFGSGL